MRGKFITLEGGEGAGKTTQIKLLGEYLTQKGIETVLTKEPGGTPIGQELRSILCTGDKDKIDAVAEALLYYADRRIHVCQKILPALNRGAWVISDRFADSTMAYQCYGYKDRISKDTLNELYKITVGDLKPDLTIILDIDPKIGLARSLERNASSQIQETRHEGRALEFHQNLRNGFLEISKTDSRYAVIDANCPVEELHKKIVRLIESRISDT